MRAADVVVNVVDDLAVFEPQNREAADCLALLCGISVENVRDKVFVGSDLKQNVVFRLRTAGFVVWG